MSKPLRVAVQMDPIEGVNPDADSTFALMTEAQSRGHRLWHYEVRHMSLREGKESAGGAPGGAADGGGAACHCAAR